MIDHLQDRLGDLSGDDSVIARFRALDHNLWPAMGDTRESKEAFVLHGRDDVIFLYNHYATLMHRHLATKADTLHEYRLYKSWARDRVTSARETYTAMLHRGTLQAYNVFKCVTFLITYTFFCVMSAVFRCLFPYIFLCDVCCFQVFVSIFFSVRCLLFSGVFFHIFFCVIAILYC